MLNHSVREQSLNKTLLTLRPALSCAARAPFQSEANLQAAKTTRPKVLSKPSQKNISIKTI